MADRMKQPGFALIVAARGFALSGDR